MVDSISRNNALAGLKRLNDDAQVRAPAGRATSLSLAAAQGDSAQVNANLLEMPAELKAGPPVELESVARIQQAIADGNYPIDLNAITNALFESYMELQS